MRGKKAASLPRVVVSSDDVYTDIKCELIKVVLQRFWLLFSKTALLGQSPEGKTFELLTRNT